MELVRVVVATDFSESAAEALAVAARFARGAGAELHVVHVVPRLVGLRPERADLRPGEREAWDEHDEPLRRRLSEWVAERAPADLDARPVLLEGDPAERIMDHARQERAGLLVIGRHGHSALERFFVGSTTEEVVRKAPCPVLVVPP